MKRKSPRKRVKKLTAAEKKAVWAKPDNPLQVVGSNTGGHGGQASERRTDKYENK